MTSRARFLQGIFEFESRGLDQPFAIDPSLAYTLPRDTEAQLASFRGGNATGRLVTAVVMRDGEPMRCFLIGAQSGTHVALGVVEDLLADTRVELHIAAPVGTGQVVIDLGLVEVG